MPEQLRVPSLITCSPIAGLWPVKSSEEERAGSTRGMAEHTEPRGSGQVCGGQAPAEEEEDSAVVYNGNSFCRGCQLHPERGVRQLPREEAICVISQRASLNLGLIKRRQYGLPDMKEPSLKRDGC